MPKKPVISKKVLNKSGEIILERKAQIFDCLKSKGVVSDSFESSNSISGIEHISFMAAFHGFDAKNERHMDELVKLIKLSEGNPMSVVSLIQSEKHSRRLDFLNELKFDIQLNAARKNFEKELEKKPWYKPIAVEILKARAKKIKWRRVPELLSKLDLSPGVALQKLVQVYFVSFEHSNKRQPTKHELVVIESNAIYDLKKSYSNLGKSFTIK